MSRGKRPERPLVMPSSGNYVRYDYNTRRIHSSNRKNFRSKEECVAKFQELMKFYEINNTFAEKLFSLYGYEIVFICDDSESMNTPLNDVSGPYEQAPTRWDELKRTVSIIVDIASVLDPDGIDVYFLNREPLFNVQNSEELNNMFALPPEGPTPIVRVFRQVLRDKREEIAERKLLIFLATDGEPTDDQGYVQINELRNALMNERRPIDRIPVTIMACTDDDECVSYLNDWDKTIPRLDVVDDYKSEKAEVLACKGNSFPFSFGDYVVKTLLGGVDNEIDEWDEKKTIPEWNY